MNPMVNDPGKAGIAVMNMYWNHNSAYYPWVQKKTENCRIILDVGCGDGFLARFLDDGTKRIVGIDPDLHCIEKARSINDSGNLQFRCCGFENYTPDMSFDAIVFVASIHHMDMEESLQKAQTLLALCGKILVVGLAKPSTIVDWVLEVARVLPSKTLSVFHHMQSSEELNLPTAYDYPAMKEIRRIVKKELPGAEIHYALH